MEKDASLLLSIRAEAEKFFSGAKGSHDLDHSLRVYSLAMHIAEKEKADFFVVGASALLHDIGRTYEYSSNGTIDHAKKSAELARDILNRLSINNRQADNIIHCILSHRFMTGPAPKTIEAKVLFDADKLDSIGAVGIGRAFLFSGEIGAKLHDKDVDIENTKPYTKDDTAYREFLVKLSKIKDNMMTKEGKKLAEERHRFMVEFFDRLNKEVEGLI